MTDVGRLLRRLAASEAWVLGATVLYALALVPFVPEILSAENLINVLGSSLPLFVAALGQTLVVITAGIDLSLTAVIALASVGGAWTMTAGVPGGGVAAVMLGVLVMLAIGAGTGALNGLAVTRIGMPPFMVTLAVMMFGGGLALWVTQSKAIHGLPSSFLALGQGSAGLAPAPLLIVLVLGIVAHIGLTRTIHGRRLFAVGKNAAAARVSGVPVMRVLLLAYIGSGLCAGLASVLYTARLETGSPVLGQRLFLDVIGATVIGGSSLFGGKGSVVGTAFGVLFITLIDNSFTLLGLSSFAVLMAKGGVILAAAAVDAVRSRRSGKAS